MYFTEWWCDNIGGSAIYGIYLFAMQFSEIM